VSIAPNDYVLATVRSSEPKQSNIRRSVFDKVVARANEKLIEAGDVPLPEGLTLTSSALRFDPRRLRRRSGQRHGSTRPRRALVGGVDWAPMGTGAPNGALPVIMAVCRRRWKTDPPLPVEY
jgi:hypothetical protein